MLYRGENALSLKHLPRREVFAGLRGDAPAQMHIELAIDPRGKVFFEKFSRPLRRALNSIASILIQIESTFRRGLQASRTPRHFSNSLMVLAFGTRGFGEDLSDHGVEII